MIGRGVTDKRLPLSFVWLVNKKLLLFGLDRRWTGATDNNTKSINSSSEMAIFCDVQQQVSLMKIFKAFYITKIC